MVYLFLAEGFEEIEALAVVDLLRRAGIETATVSVSGQAVVEGAHKIQVVSDKLLRDVDLSTAEMLVLPGGMPGTLNLENTERLRDFILEADRREIFLAAICAAPSILGHMGLLDGKQAVCYPGYETELTGAVVLNKPTIRDNRIITGKAAGCVFEFAYEIIKALADEQTADTVINQIYYAGRE